MNLGVFAVVAPAVCADADDRMEGETALTVELWLAECLSAKWLLVGGAVLEVLWAHQLAASLSAGVWVGERDSKAELPYGTGEDGFRGECSGLGLREVGVKCDNGDSGQGEWSGCPGLWCPGETGDMGPDE